ncbi:glucagon receptor [Microcaecilia unicolor]|uniref:Glucagon receptor n=1 Tax=Microcaecilia unicolor TaxID=1415580 RepID=A0A6P7Y7R9_9AMPH|nr:glucagon receptor [Microcaecilia unicolor]
MCRLFLHSVLLALLFFCQGPSAQMTDYVYKEWRKYETECQQNMSQGPAPTELVCNRTFDRFACWPDALPNTTVRVSCPWYLPWHSKVQDGYVYRRCGPDGQWIPMPNGHAERNATECEKNGDELRDQKQYGQTYQRFMVTYTVGYSVSLGTLILALSILAGFSKLHCTRNYIHMNLFASFILKCSSILVIDALLKTRYNQVIDDDFSVQLWLSSDALAGCRAASVLMQYGIIANYCWLLAEGIYLHNLLKVAGSSEKSYFTLYVFIGWGAPVAFVVPWVAVKYKYENIQCWTTHNHMGFWWIPRSAVFLCILINFVMFIRIIRILVSKLWAHQMRYTDSKLRLAKSTLILFLMLGTHEVIFAFVTEELTQGTMRDIKLFFDIFLGSFQGMLVAILYCFMNKEVQSELLKTWKRWKVGKDIEEAYRHTYTTRTGINSMTDQYQLVSSNGTHKDSSAHVFQHTTEHLTLSEQPQSYGFLETAESSS